MSLITGGFVTVRGMNLKIMLVSVHKVMLPCDVFQGEAELAVCSAFPIQGVSVILGNDFLGACVWAPKPLRSKSGAVARARMALERCLRRIGEVLQGNSRCIFLIFLCRSGLLRRALRRALKRARKYLIFSMVVVREFLNTGTLELLRNYFYCSPNMEKLSF